MATTYGMTAPMMSSTMPNPMGTVQTAMTPSMMGQSPMGMNNANMNLPLSTARPIEVTETTPNLEQIQNFPVAGRAADGTHFHQDPVSGQMYRMSAELHDRIPEILRNLSIKIKNIDTNYYGEKLKTDLSPVSNNNTSLFTDSMYNLNKSITSNIYDDYIHSLGESEKIKVINQYDISNVVIGNEYLNKISIENKILNSDYVSTTNIFYNKLINNTSNIESEYYKPINSFFNTSYNQMISVYRTSYFLPINKFINR